MDKKEFVEQAENLIENFETLIKKMPYQGDKSEASQKVLLANNLMELSYAVNGIKGDDFSSVGDDVPQQYTFSITAIDWKAHSRSFELTTKTQFFTTL